MKKIILMIDDVPYTSKDAALQEMGIIKTRFTNTLKSIKEVTIKELFDYISKGHTITPAILEGGMGSENWFQQEMIFIDIDNKYDDIITPDAAIDLLKENGINVLGYYHTFSSSDIKPRFRLILRLNEPINNAKKMQYVLDTLYNFFIPQADKSCSELAKVFLGTDKRFEIIDEEATITLDDMKRIERYTGNEKDMIAFAKWLVPKLEIKLYYGELYFKANGKYITNETLLSREIAKYIELNRVKNGELKHQLYIYADLIDAKTYEFKIHLRNGVISNNEVIDIDGGFSPFYLDVTYDVAAYDEHVDNFLNFLSCNRADLRAVLEEILGHILLVNKFPHKIFIFQGSGANGKSTFIEMTTKWTGDLSSHIDISAFDDGTSLTSLIGKLVNIADDIDALYIEKSKNLKTMASGNTVGCRAIYSTPITIKNTASLIFTTNEPPSFKDKSDGLIRRLMIIPLDNKVSVKTPNIDDLLSSDNAKSYLLNLALAGAKRIYDNNLELSTCDAITNATRLYHIENDSVQSFLEEHPTLFRGQSTFQTLYNKYCGYTDVNNLRAVSSSKFSRRLTSLGCTTEVRRPTYDNGKTYGNPIRFVKKEGI